MFDTQEATKMQTIAEKLSKMAQRESYGMNRKTAENKLRSINLMLDVIEGAGFTSFDEISNLSDDAEFDVLVRLDDAISKAVQAGHFGKTKATITKRLGNAYRTMKKAGVNLFVVEKLRLSQSEMLIKSGISLTKIDYVPTPSDAMEIMQVIESVKAGDIHLEYRGSKLSPEQFAQASLYAMIGMTYQVRASTQRLIEWSHITESNITLWLKKQKGAELTPMLREMYENVWNAVEHWKSLSEAQNGIIWTNAGDVPKWAGEIIKATTIPSRITGKIGFHCFRDAFATYCFNNDIRIEITAQALGHKDSKVTERHYVSMTAKQQQASEAVGKFAKDFLGLSKKLSVVGQKMKVVSEHFKKAVMWSQKSTDYFLQPENHDSMKFLLDCGVNPSESAVYTIDSITDSEIVSPGFEPKSVTTPSLDLAGQELLPVLNDALAEIEQGSALQAKAILQALKEVFE
jgi:hypothetical protein